LFFNNLVIRHIESSVSQLSLFSLFSTISLLWTQFWASVDTKVDTKNHHRNDKIKSTRRDRVLVSTFPGQEAKKIRCNSIPQCSRPLVLVQSWTCSNFEGSDGSWDGRSMWMSIKWSTQQRPRRFDAN